MPVIPWLGITGEHPKELTAKYALSFSGGKDSALALDRAVRDGLEIACLFNIYEGSSDRVRFHGVPASLIAAQAAALGIPLVQESTQPDDYETVFLRVLDSLKREEIDGLVFGNIHLEDIRSWYEERTFALGFRHVEPLWGAAPAVLVGELIDRGYVARLVSVDPTRAPVSWISRILDRGLLSEILARSDIDPCGERGEYHTFVENGPTFQHPVVAASKGTLELEGHVILDLAL